MGKEANVGVSRRKRVNKSGSGTVTVVDVAKHAGVSTATVSRVLNGVSSVDPALAARVQSSIEATGYVLNIAGRTLRRQRAEVWAAIVPDINTPFFTSVVASLERVAVGHGFTVVLCNTDKRVEQEQKYILTAIAQQMSGVVMAPTSVRGVNLAPLRENGMPIVLIDGVPESEDVDTVIMDNYLAGGLAARHLLAQGFARPACIAGNGASKSAEDRLQGFADGYSAAGMPLPDSMIRRTDLRTDGSEVAARSLLLSRDIPDSIFAVNGPATVGAFRALQAAEIAMPQQVGLVGTDDDTWTQMVSPPVTVIQQPVDRIGRLAAELLLSHDEASPPRKIVLPPILVPRASTMRI